MYGLFRPVVLIPTELNGVSDQDLKLAMMYELVHIKRYDLWVNALQSLLTMTHFYNPAVWIANIIIRQLCEEAVDETVVSLEGDIEPYSHARINISETVSHKPSIGLNMVGVMESRKAVYRRIKHMWTCPIPQRVRISTFGFIAIVTLGALLLPMVHGAQTPAVDKDPNGFHLLVLDNCDPCHPGRSTVVPPSMDRPIPQYPSHG
ncbi:MAG: M56 family metallopeptidase [Planctomycetes bacterium]|nr:M56 family metallopeptidase [Planctomycetota bacterium]